MNQEKPGMLPLQVSENGRFLEKLNGESFFWLGDTGWRLFPKLNREEAVRYLKDRHNKGFTVIQCHVLPWNLDEVNPYGYTAFVDREIHKPVEEYWEHVDFILDTSEELGLYMAVLPAWARTFVETRLGKEEDKIFSDRPEDAYDYGFFIGDRYKDRKNIIWILGGDSWGTQDTVYYSMAKGIADGAADGDFNKLLMSYHPKGGTYRPPATSTGEFYHNKEWLDFNMIQSGHRIGNRNFERITEDYQRIPVKPTLDSEPCYEHHPIMHKFENGEFNAWHLRRRGYWSVLAGGFGYTYGGNGIWQMAKPDDKGKESHFNYYWYEALEYEGGNDMQHLRALFESRPFIEPERIPDQTILKSINDSVDFHIQCARADDLSYWIAYITNGCEFDLDHATLNGIRYNAWWYNPRDGLTYDNDYEQVSQPFTELDPSGNNHFNPPGETGPENDWVLILDDPESGYEAPGIRK